MKKNYVFSSVVMLSLAFLTTPTLTAQNIGINANGAAPAASAGLDVNFTNKGLLIPRVALTAANLAGPIAAPATSLLVYNTATAGASPNNVLPGYYCWNGTRWVAVGGSGGLDWSLTGNAGTNATTNFLGTTDNIALRIRTNNANRFEFTTNGRFRSFNGGSATEPTYSWTGDANTGIFNSGTDVLGFSTAGVERYRVNANGQFLINTATPTDPNLFEARVTAGNYWVVNSYNTTTASGSGFFLNSAGGNGFNAVEATTAGSNAGIWGWNQASGTGVRGTVANTAVGWAGFFQGDVGCTGTYFGSDERWKKNIRNIETETSGTVLSKLMQIQPKKYEWRSDEFPGMGFDPDKISYGFIAQELEQIFPDLVNSKKVIPNPTKEHKSRTEADNVTGYYMVDYIGLIPILTKGIQEQQTIIEAQNAKIEALEKMVLELQKAIENK